MSNYDFMQNRRRGKHSLIVEGKHEKEELLPLILKCFPEIKIQPENIVLFGTNIYQLYSGIVKEYGSDWFNDDVDLPYVVSKMKKLETTWYGQDFIDVFLIFDFERQDTYYSGETIKKMQSYFIDSTDMGKLYINYPMVESYWDTYDMPGESFKYRKRRLPMRRGNAYKTAVKNTKIALAVKFPAFLDDVFEKEYGISDVDIRKDCVERILSLSSQVTLAEDIEEILRNGKTSERNIKTAKAFLQDKILRIGYTQEKITYYAFMKKELCKIICRSIRKANMVQGGEYELQPDQLKEVFTDLDYVRIVDEQCNCSSDEQNGFIWVLNTSVFFVPDYSFDFVELS